MYLLSATPEHERYQSTRFCTARSEGIAWVSVANDFQPSTSSHGFAQAPGAVRWGIAVGAIAYVGYLGLLLTCDLRRVEPLGFVPRFQAGVVTISDVQPDSAGGRAGLRSGDLMKTRQHPDTPKVGPDWQRVRTHLDPSKPLEMVIERGGAHVHRAACR